MHATILPDWIAAEVEAGRTDLQLMLDRAPFDAAAVRTVAESGDFAITGDGQVQRVSPTTVGTWFPQSEPLLERGEGGSWSMAVTVTEELLAGASVPVPRAVAGLLEVPRRYRRALSSRLGPQVVHLSNEHALTGSIRRFLEDLGTKPRETVHLVFDPAGMFEVRS